MGKKLYFLPAELDIQADHEDDKLFQVPKEYSILYPPGGPVAKFRLGTILSKCRDAKSYVDVRSHKYPAKEYLNPFNLDKNSLIERMESSSMSGNAGAGIGPWAHLKAAFSKNNAKTNILDVNNMVTKSFTPAEAYVKSRLDAQEIRDKIRLYDYKKLYMVTAYQTGDLLVNSSAETSDLKVGGSVTIDYTSVKAALNLLSTSVSSIANMSKRIESALAKQKADPQGAARRQHSQGLLKEAKTANDKTIELSGKLRGFLNDLEYAKLDLKGAKAKSVAAEAAEKKIKAATEGIHETILQIRTSSGAASNNITNTLRNANALDNAEKDIQAAKGASDKVESDIRQCNEEVASISNGGASTVEKAIKATSNLDVSADSLSEAIENAIKAGNRSEAAEFALAEAKRASNKSNELQLRLKKDQRDYQTALDEAKKAFGTVNASAANSKVDEARSKLTESTEAANATSGEITSALQRAGEAAGLVTPQSNAEGSSVPGSTGMEPIEVGGQYSRSTSETKRHTGFNVVLGYALVKIEFKADKNGKILQMPKLSKHFGPRLLQQAAYMATMTPIPKPGQLELKYNDASKADDGNDVNVVQGLFGGTEDEYIVPKV